MMFTYICAQILMNANLQTLVEPVMSVTTPLDPTGVNVPMDLLLLVVHRTH